MTSSTTQSSRAMPFVDWLTQSLYAQGTRRLFGVPGGGTSLDLIDSAQRAGMELVLTAREDAAVIMAGVSGVLAEAPGLAFSTKGPGLASASNGLASAALDRLPALLVAETFGPGELDYVSHQVFDQGGAVTPLLNEAGGAVLADSVTEAQQWLERGPRPPRRPAVMFPTAAALRSNVTVATVASQEINPDPLDPAALEAASALLANSKRPVIIVGLEAARPAIAGQITALVERLNAPVLGTYMAAGTVPSNHPNYAGIFTGGAVEQRCVNEADLIVLIGLDPVELIRKPWTYEAPVLDLCEVARTPHYLTPKVRLQAQLENSLASLASATTQAVWTTDEIAAHRDYFHEQLAISSEHGITSRAVVDTLAEHFGSSPHLAVDAGAHMFSACASWPATQPRDILISNGLATMGFAVPAAIAAALHNPKRGAVAITGDGGLLMCLGELKTAASTGADVCIVVCNDGRLSLIDIKREERQMQDLGLSWQPPDFAAVASGFGLSAWRAETPAQLQAACQEASEVRGPRLIDAVIDSSGYFMQMKALRG